MIRLLLLALLAPAAASAAALPSFLSVPAQVQPGDDAVRQEEWGEAAIPTSDEGDPPVRRGRHWAGSVPFTGLPDEITGNDVWAKMKPALQKGGWTVVKEFDAHPFSATVRLQKGGHDAWAWFMIIAPTDIRMEVVDVAPQPVKLALLPPAQVPEKFARDHGDFPYLPPLPGSQAGEQGWEPDETLTAPVPGQDEEQLVAVGRMKRFYTRPGTSNVQFATVYREALKAAGWTLVVDSQGLNQTDAAILAHYAKGARELWASLHHAGEEYMLSVADAGAQDLGAQLAKECHVPLYGVLFDFDKATLRPESDGVLARAAAALKAHPQLAVEVQGHTDDVGKADYNRTLSDKRAQAVLAWLVKNGVPAAQVTAKGYGKERPVAPNDDAAGRAKNRRVELACRK